MDDAMVTLLMMGFFIVVFYIDSKTKRRVKINIDKNIEIQKEMKRIDDLTPREFEHYVCGLLKILGYRNIEVTQQTADGGKDIICVDKNGNKVYVECKHYKKDSHIGRPMIQKLVGSMCLDGVKRGIFITTSSFTRTALECKNDYLELWDRDDIKWILEKQRKAG